MNGSSNLLVLGVKGQDERPLRGALDSPPKSPSDVYADVGKQI